MCRYTILNRLLLHKYRIIFEKKMAFYCFLAYRLAKAAYMPRNRLYFLYFPRLKALLFLRAYGLVARK